MSIHDVFVLALVICILDEVRSTTLAHKVGNMVDMEWRWRDRLFVGLSMLVTLFFVFFIACRVLCNGRTCVHIFSFWNEELFYLSKVCLFYPECKALDFMQTYEVFPRSLLGVTRVVPDQGLDPPGENLVRVYVWSTHCGLWVDSFHRGWAVISCGGLIFVLGPSSFSDSTPDFR